MLRKTLTGLLCLSLAAGGVTVLGRSSAEAEPEPSRIVGDVNCDGRVDTFDLVELREIISSSSTWKFDGYHLKNADIDGSGKADLYDLELLSDFLLSNGNMSTEFSPIGSIRLGESLTVKPTSAKAPDEVFVLPQMKFSTGLLRSALNAEPAQNTLVSPLSVTAALAMTANGAEGATLSEIVQTLGGELTIDQLDQYLSYTIDRLNSTKSADISVLNSVWFRNNDPKFSVKDSFLEDVYSWFSAEAYGTPFNSDTITDINSWVKNGTKGMIPELYPKDKDFRNVMMCLINTTYFSGDWSSRYIQSYPGSFTSADGVNRTVDTLYSKEYYYINGDGYTGFRKDYGSGEFGFVGILPEEGVALTDFVNGLDPEELLSSVQNPRTASYPDDYFELETSMPKVKYECSYELKDMLRELGIETAFDSELADFSGISETMPLYIDSTVHKTVIDINEIGTKAAAVTSVEVAAGAGYVEKHYYVYLDRPYIYMIVDNSTGLPLFMGAVTEVK